MKINTNKYSLITTSSGINCYKTIFHWHYRNGDLAHCLVRYYVQPNIKRALFVVSEIRSNYLTGGGVSNDFCNLANAIFRDLPTEIEADPLKTIWLEHYGYFSSYDALDREEFSKVNLKWSGEFYSSGYEDWELLDRETLDKILATYDCINLESVELVLKELNWKY